MATRPDGRARTVPLSAVNQFLFCQRRAALIHNDGIFIENEHTIVGALAHEHADLPGYETAAGVTLLRALPVFSDRLGLSGKCDIVEHHPDGGLYPVEYKKGRRRRFDNDDAQLCAQALCLEEMTGRAVPAGAIFFATTKRRREVRFTAELRRLTEDAVGALHELLAPGQAPPAVLKPACQECSLYAVCLPQLTAAPGPAARAAAALFRP
ncbi:MAG: CRISPR-associated protein Cas4 [Terriglobales bacterium]